MARGHRDPAGRRRLQQRSDARADAASRRPSRSPGRTTPRPSPMRIVAAWAAGDYAAMYATLDPGQRERYPLESLHRAVRRLRAR